MESFLFFPVVGLSLVWGVLIAVLLYIAGKNVRDLRGHSLAVVACILAMLPCHPAFFITLPLGLWTLVVLLRPGMRAAFETAAGGTQPPAGPMPSDKPLPTHSPFSPADQRGLEKRVGLCAMGLRIAGSIDLLGWLALSYFCVAKTIESGSAPSWLALGFSLWGLRMAAGSLVLVGAHHLANFRSRGWAWIGAIVSLVPASPGWIVGFPSGLWAIYLLTRPQTQIEFEQRKALAESDSLGWRPWAAGAVMAIAFFSCVGFILSSQMMPRSSQPVATYSYTMPSDPYLGTAPAGITSDATSAMPSGMGAGMGMGTTQATDSGMLTEIDGELKLDPFVVQTGRMTQEQEVEVNAALKDVHREYRAIEAAHTSKANDADGNRVITVAPFPADARNNLENTFWSRVDPLLTSDDQRRETRGWLSFDRVCPFQMGVTLEYRKVGSFYRWRSNPTPAEGYGYNWREDPRLPGQLQRLIDADLASMIDPPAPE